MTPQYPAVEVWGGNWEGGEVGRETGFGGQIGVGD